MSTELVQVFLQVPMVGLFTYLVIRLLKMFQDRDAVREEARCQERRELTSVVSNNTEAIRQLTGVVQLQVQSAQETSDTADSIKDDTSYIRTKLDQHHELVRDRLK